MELSKSIAATHGRRERRGVDQVKEESSRYKAGEGFNKNSLLPSQTWALDAVPEGCHRIANRGCSCECDPFAASLHRTYELPVNVHELRPVGSLPLAEGLERVSALTQYRSVPCSLSAARVKRCMRRVPLGHDCGGAVARYSRPHRVSIPAWSSSRPGRS